jgi:hypothetical protein
MSKQNYKLLRTLEFECIVPLYSDAKKKMDIHNREFFIPICAVYSTQSKLFGFEFRGGRMYFKGRITPLEVGLDSGLQQELPVRLKMGFPCLPIKISDKLYNDLPQYIYEYEVTDYDDGMLIHPKKIIYSLNKEGIK